MKSKKNLFVDLSIYFNNDEYASKGLKAKGISDETYGRKSMIYIDAKNPADRKNLENFLSMKSYKVNRDYYPGSAILEVQVSYFKGNQWNV